MERIPRMQRRLTRRIDVGDDCVLVYECAGKTSIVVTTRDNGDAEIVLDATQCASLIEALGYTLEHDQSWSVWRQGDDGNEFLVKDDLTDEEARELVSTYESRGHKQLYWARRASDT